MHIGWEAVAAATGAILPDGSLRAGDDVGRRVAAVLLGTDVLREAVECFVTGRSGAWAAESLIVLLQPPEAIEEAWICALNKKASVLERRYAVGLLTKVARASDAERVDILLRDSDLAIRVWAVDLAALLAEAGVRRAIGRRWLAIATGAADPSSLGGRRRLRAALGRTRAR